MRRIPGTAIALILCAGTLTAQTRPGKIGIGVSVSPTIIFSEDDLTSTPATFYVPIQLASSFRLEPEFSYVGASVEETDPFSGDKFEGHFSGKILAVGALFMFRSDGDFTAYVGPRIGMRFMSETSKFTGTPEESRTRNDLTIGFALGGEHYLSKHFSLGAEARLTRISAGDEKVDPDDGAPPFDASLTQTQGLFFARFFF